MTHYLTARNAIEAELLAIRKFFANDRRTSNLTQATSKRPVFKCELINGVVKVTAQG